MKQKISSFFKKINNQEYRPIPETPYFSYKIPRWCWMLNQNFFYEIFLTLLAFINALTLALVKYPEDDGESSNLLRANIDYISVIVTVIFFIDQLIKLIGSGFILYIKSYENLLYSVTSVGSLVHLAINNWQATPITALTVFKVFKIIRRQNYY